MIKFIKKILISLSCLVLLSNAALAAKFKLVVEVLEPFDSNNPPKTLTTRVIEEYQFNNGYRIEKGCMFEGEVTEIIQPKRGKRDGYFYYKPITYTRPSKDNEQMVIEDGLLTAVKAKYYKPLDKKEIAFDAAATTAGFFVHGISYPINFARGVIEPYDGKNRLTSGVQKVYEKSPLVYALKGESMKLMQGDIITLIFYYDRDEDD